ncbi:type IV pilus secretin family protein, partial [bacterium]
MKIVIKKLPWALMALMLVAGCAAPNSQMKASVEEAAVARVLSVSGEELPDRVRLTIEGTAPLAYTVFRLSEPTRLIVDLADTDVTQLDSVIAIGLGNVSLVTPEQFDEEAGQIGRLEVALIEVWDYETSRVENEIVIDFIKPVAVEETAAAMEESVVEEPAAPAADEALMAGTGTVEVVELGIPEETAEPAQETEPEYVAPPLDPATSIDRVLFYEEDGHFSVELVADGAVGRYDALNLTGPSRLVVDVWDVAKGFKPSTIPVEMSGVSRIRVGEHHQEGKLRFVLDLETDQVPPYTLETRGERLVVTLGLEGPGVMPEVAAAAEETVVEPVQPAPVVEPAVAVIPEPQSAEPVAPSGPSVTDIRYRSEDSGGAVLIIADSPVEFSITQPDTRHLLIDLEGTVLPANLVRSQDTRDVGGPLLALSSFNPKGEKSARVSLTYESGTSFETEQAGGTLTLVLTAPEVTEPPVTVAAVTVPVIEPATGSGSAGAVPASVEAPAPEKTPSKTMEEDIVIREKGPQYTGELMTLDFQNADILNVLRLIAEVSGLNIITGEGVGGKISMRMVNVPWDQALDVILKTKGLGQVRE